MGNDLGMEIMKNIFHFVQKSYNIRSDSNLQRQRNHRVSFETESISSRAPKISVPQESLSCETGKAISLYILVKILKL